MTTPMTDHVTARATWRPVNISTMERVGRVLVGLVGVAAGVLLLDV